MKKIQEELAKGTPPYMIMEKLCPRIDELGVPFYLSDLMVFELLIEEFYRQQCAISEIEHFFMMKSVVTMIENKEIPLTELTNISNNFFRLTGMKPNRFALDDAHAKERYRLALNVLYNL